MGAKYGKSKCTSRKGESKPIDREIIEHVKRVIEESKQIREESRRVSELLRQTIERSEINR